MVSERRLTAGHTLSTWLHHATRQKVKPPRLVAPHQRHRGALASPSGHGRPHALSEIFLHRLLISAPGGPDRKAGGAFEVTAKRRHIPGGRGQVGHGCGRGTKTRSETVSLKRTVNVQTRPRLSERRGGEDVKVSSSAVTC